MTEIPDIDPTKDDTGAAGGARGGGDDDAQDLNLPGGPTEAPDEQRKWWSRGARPKTKGPYTQLPQHDKGAIPLTTFSKEHSGLPSTSKATKETSFMDDETTPLGRVLTAKEKAVILEVEDYFPFMDPDIIQFRYHETVKGIRTIIEVKMVKKDK